jgi:hypothetical protein
MINCLHHFEILTNSSSNLLKYLLKGFNFDLVVSRQTPRYDQYIVRAESINFFITSPRDLSKQKNNLQSLSTSNDFSSISYIEENDPKLFKKITQKENTVFNAAFQV